MSGAGWRGCNFWFPSLASRLERTSDAFESRQRADPSVYDGVSDPALNSRFYHNTVAKAVDIRNILLAGLKPAPDPGSGPVLLRRQAISTACLPSREVRQSRFASFARRRRLSLLSASLVPPPLTGSWTTAAGRLTRRKRFFCLAAASGRIYDSPPKAGPYIPVSTARILREIVQSASIPPADRFPP